MYSHSYYRYTDEPFTSYMPEALFNISRYLMHELLFEQPKGVSKFAVHYALAKQARNLGAFKLSRLVMEKIQKLVIPKRFRENVDLAALMIRSKPYYDNEELLTICYRCSTTNPLYNPKVQNSQLTYLKTCSWISQFQLRATIATTVGSPLSTPSCRSKSCPWSNFNSRRG